MKVVYMGTPDFAVGPLQAMLSGGVEVLAVVTQPDRPKGRSKGAYAVSGQGMRHAASDPGSAAGADQTAGSGSRAEAV